MTITQTKSQTNSKLYDFGKEYEEIAVDDFLEESAALYSAEVNLNRSVPDIRDGLKPVHRRSLYGMYEMGLDPTKPHKKSARISGDVMGKYHPHGDSIYGAFALLAQDFTMNEKLVDPHGKFGSINGSSPAAQRYTEARLSKAGYLMVKDLAKDAVEMIPNFDGSEVEPRVLPSPFPQALLNGQSGIGWSLATSIAPHNINELIDLSIYLATTDKENVDIDQVKKLFKGPDIMTGCDVIMSDEEYLKSLTTGISKFIQRSVIEYEVTKKYSAFIVKNLPYKITTDVIKQQIITELTSSKAFELEDVEDKTSGNNVNIKFIFKKGVSEERLKQIVEHLFKKTSLQTSFSANNIMIHRGRPTSFGVLQYLRIFNSFRLETLRRMWNYDNQKLLKRLHLIEALLKLEDVTDEVISIAKQSDSKSDFEKKIIEKFSFTKQQAEYISSIQLYQLGRTNFEALRNEQSDKLAKSKELETWLTDEVEANKQLINDLNHTKSEFKQSVRKSKILDDSVLSNVKTIKFEEMIEDKPVKVVIKRDLEMIQIGHQAYNNQISSYEDDDIVAVLDTRTTEYVIAVTNEGQSVTRLVNDLPRIELTGKSTKFNKQVPDLTSNAQFVGGFVVNKKDRIIFLSKLGFVKFIDPITASPKTSTKLYLKKTKQLVKFKDHSDELIFVKPITLKQMNNHELRVILNDETKKSGIQTRKVKLNKYVDKTHGLGGNGSRLVNIMSKDRELTIKSSNIVKVESVEKIVEE